MGPIQRAELVQLIRSYGADVVIDAIRRAVANGVGGRGIFTWAAKCAAGRSAQKYLRAQAEKPEWNALSESEVLERLPSDEELERWAKTSNGDES
jgi:hypothetical protein